MVMSQIVTDEQVIAADDADVLAGTRLDQPGAPGVYTMWVVSTQLDTLFSISLGGREVTTNAVAQLRANAEIRENEDPYFQVLSMTGGRPVINVNVVTAASVRIRTRFLPALAT